MLQGTAVRLGIQFVDISLRRGVDSKIWRSPQTGRPVRVEEAVLDLYRIEGWHGYAGEGGLLLNLIKAMSFEALDVRHRSVYVEALYAQNVAFDEDRFDPKILLRNILTADKKRVVKNFDVMASGKVEKVTYGDRSHSTSECMLDYCPGLERCMFTELLEVAGISLILSVAEKFSEPPYDHRRGWPDLTIWRGNELRFIEVKAPGDRVHKSQREIIANFAKPLGLDFWLAEVRDAGI